MTMAKWISALATLLVIVLVQFSEVSAQPVLQDLNSDCPFPNTSMISTTACSHNDSRIFLPRLTLACLSYLDEEDDAPSAQCCAGVRNVSALSPPCLCKHVFYPGPMANHTRGKLMPGLCNVTSDLCRICSAFLVDRVWAPRHSSVESVEKISSYKRKVLGLAVILGFAMACVVVGIALLIRRKLKQRKTLPPVTVKSDFQSKQPGCDY
ncbi:hypothetical protein M758_9G068800 [Ceratodon purpureus]|nr:hypothetical protein M758_9G068800 [Ceratodon purpureus]